MLRIKRMACGKSWPLNLKSKQKPSSKTKWQMNYTEERGSEEEWTCGYFGGCDQTESSVEQHKFSLWNVNIRHCVQTHTVCVTKCKISNKLKIHLQWYTDRETERKRFSSTCRHGIRHNFEFMIHLRNELKSLSARWKYITNINKIIISIILFIRLSTKPLATKVYTHTLTRAHTPKALAHSAMVNARIAR